MGDPNLPGEQWRALFDAKGIEFGYRPLATRAGMNHTRVRRVLRGEGTTEDAIRQVATALGTSPARVHELRGEPAVEHQPFTLPDDAGKLNDREREVIRAMVRVLLDARDRHADQPADTAPPAQQGTSSSPSKDKKTEAGDPRVTLLPVAHEDEDDQDLAARDTGGISEGEQTRRDMDQQGEAPDPEGPEDGA